MGFGKSSSSSTVNLTPEQRETLQLQNAALRDVFMPAYTSTVGGAGQVYNTVNPAAATAAQTAMDVGQRAGALQETGGSQAYRQGLGGTSNLAGYQQGLGQGLTGYGAGQLSQLFSPQYQQQQIQAALQPATEDIREQMNQQGALFGGAGGLGSSRQALASQNLASLGQARLGNIAAQTAANIAGQRQAAASTLLGAGQAASGQAAGLYGQLLGAGQQGLQGAQQAAAGRIGYAQTPQDVYSRYASVVFGVPQSSTTPNYAGTQGGSTSGKGAGIKFN